MFLGGLTQTSRSLTVRITLNLVHNHFSVIIWSNGYPDTGAVYQQAAMSCPRSAGAKCPIAKDISGQNAENMNFYEDGPIADC